MTDLAFGLLALAALVVANAIATLVAFRDPYSEKRQKVAQTLAIWLLPILGAIFIFALHRKPEEPSGKYAESLDPPSDDPTTSRYVGRAIKGPLDGSDHQG